MMLLMTNNLYKKIEVMQDSLSGGQDSLEIKPRENLGLSTKTMEPDGTFHFNFSSNLNSAFLYSFFSTKLRWK